MRKLILISAVCVGIVSVVACKSAPTTPQETPTLSDQLNGESTPTPEPDTTSTDIASAETPAPAMAEPTPEPPAVQGLGSSSSGLGR